MPKLEIVGGTSAKRAKSTQPAAAVSDAAARERALDITTSFIIEAPAGSGKTGLLLQRYLKLLASSAVMQPEEVLAITFTNKATAELRERIVRQLHLADASRHAAATHTLSPFELATRDLAAAVLERDAAQQWGLLTRPQRLNIRTIDSLCAEIARTLPLLSLAGAPRTPATDADELYRLAAQRTVLQLGGTDLVLNSALETVLLHRDGSLHDVEGLLAGMLQTREQWAELIPFSPGDREEAALESVTRPKLESALNAIVCAGLTRAVHAMPAAMLKELAAIAAHLSGAPAYKSEVSPIAICASRHMPPEEKAEHLEHWVALIHLLLKKDGDWRSRLSRADLLFELSASDAQRLKEIVLELREDESLREALCAVRCLPPAHYPDEQWRVAKALFHLLVRALAELKLVFAERDACDFTEFSLAARHALAEPGPAEYSVAFGASLRHLLVDEMQDTSAAQYDLIERLTASWDGGSQTLFLVGDPKQSIYAFRQARVERFLRVRREKRLGTVPLECLDLTANFRSQETLVENFNNDFEQIFPAQEILDQSADVPLDVPFIAASAVRQKTPHCERVWHTTVLGEDVATRDLDKSEQAARHAEEEALEVRRIIERWQQTPLPADRKLDEKGQPKPWRIAILARARAHLQWIVRELNASDSTRQSIPFRAIDIEPLDQRAEVLDALALTRALLHPADRAAWLAVLHAPWCGLGLADLLHLAGGGEHDAANQALPAYIEARQPGLSADGQALLDRAWPVLSQALASRGRTSLCTLVERTWRTLGGDATLDAAQAKNVARFFNLLQELEQPGARVDLDQLATRMKNLYAEPQTAANIHVEIVTIHKAKGLEWDVVIVPGLQRQGQHTKDRLLNWLERDASSDSEASIVLAPIHGKGGASSKLNEWMKSVRSAREAAERKRLFYVACTRAQEELHLFAAVSRTKDGFSTGSGSLLTAAWPAAKQHFSNASPLPLDEADAVGKRPSELQTFALAASAEDVVEKRSAPPLLHRLPLSFDPRARFTTQASPRLAYPVAPLLAATPNFDRPEGSYEARALGNVVHRFLQLLAERLADAATSVALSADIENAWLPRLTASLRAEGLPPAAARSQATVARRALRQTLADPHGLWLLSPHTQAANERSLRLAVEAAGLRVDRSFFAGAAPLDAGDSHFWIVDFKTSAQSTTVPADFDDLERAKYGPQLETYARAQIELLLSGTAAPPIMLALYYPLLPRLISWPYTSASSSSAVAASHAAPSTS